jgi:MATE family multidrug resistance protein
VSRQRPQNRAAGSIAEMLAMALPMVASASADTLMTFTDRLFLSKLGPAAMNAAMAGGLASFMAMTLFAGLIGYTTALVAQQLGAGSRPRAALAAGQGVWLALAAWPLLALLRPLAGPVFGHLGLDAAQLPLQVKYFSILILGAGLGLLRGALAGFFCGIGRPRVVMAAALTALAVNALAAWLLIFGHWGLPAWGIQGAAVGTLIGSGAGLLVLLAHALAPGLRRDYQVARALRFDRGLMLELLRFGYPSGLELFLNLLAFNLLIILFQAQGASVATATSIMFSWDMVSFVPLIGVEQSVTSLVGRAVGAGDFAAAEKAAGSGIRLTWGYSAIIFALFVGLPGVLVAVFAPRVPTPAFLQAAPLAVAMLRLASLYVLVQGALMVYTGALRGAGDTLWAMLLTVAMHWCLVSAAWLCLKPLGLGPLAAWACVVATFVLFPILLRWRWKSRRWQRSRV